MIKGDLLYNYEKTSKSLKMSNITLSLLIDKLYNGEFLESLLSGINISSFDSKDTIGIRWEEIPYFLPTTLPRSSFKLETSDGDYLLKLNCKNSQIHREGTICRILNSRNYTNLIAPQIVAMEPSIILPGNKNCGWLLTKWIKGTPVSQSNFEDITIPFTKSLIELHTTPVKNYDVQLLFSTPLPNNDIAFSILRERRRQHFNDLLNICGSYIKPSILFFQDIVDKISFSPHLSFIHGDLHINNIKKLGQKNNTGTKLLLFDWEDVSLDHPLSDLANLMFSENFSMASVNCLESYINLYNKKHSRGFPLSSIDAWLLSSVWFSRNLHWKLQSSPDETHRYIEMKASDVALTIIRAIETLNYL